MDRREWLGLVGSGVGVTLGGAAARGDEHGPNEKGDESRMAPVQALHAHFCGIHIAKSNPKFQLVAQHYCMSKSEEMHQCLLYDTTEKNAKLLGVEYIISDRLFRQLPDAEKKYWHPHTYEVLAGGLIAPSMKPDDEMAFMKALLTTWGKTWHTWPDPQTPIPMGEPLLMWAVTGDGQIDERVVAAQQGIQGRRGGNSRTPMQGHRLRSTQSLASQINRSNRPTVDRPRGGRAHAPAIRT